MAQATRPALTKPPRLIGLAKRSVMLHGHATSVALEEPFWDALSRWAAEEGQSVAALISAIDRSRSGGSLASALRVAVLAWAMDGRSG